MSYDPYCAWCNERHVARGPDCRAMTPTPSTAEPVEQRAIRAACDWPNGWFTFHDDPGEHDPCYVVMPGGASLPLNHHNGEGVDIARAKFIIAACNAALSDSRAPNCGNSDGKLEAAANHLELCARLQGESGRPEGDGNASIHRQHARAITKALQSTDEIVEVLERVKPLFPITVNETADYAELTFGEHQTQAMTMDPATWLALNDLSALLLKLK